MRSDPSFPWARAWRARDFDPRAPAPEETWSQIARFPALVLLGAPGLGKTHELHRAAKDIEVAGGQFSFVQLRHITRAEDLATFLEESPHREEWEASGKIWTIFLDGYDEAVVPFE